MGILSIFGKKDTARAGKDTAEIKEEIKEEVKEEVNEAAEAAEEVKEEATDKRPSFVYGVQEVFGLTDSNDIVVIGKVKGMISMDDEVMITNPGDDQPVRCISKVIGMEINKTKVDHATDCLVVLKILNGANSLLKIGSVIHSANATNKDIRQAYISAMGDSFVLIKNFEFKDFEIENMSIADAAEAWKLYGWYVSKNELAKTDEQKADYKRKTEPIIEHMCKKVLSADEIYVVCNTLTGEPHLFSKTIRQEQGFMCTPPEILIIPPAYVNEYKKIYSKGDLELKRITKGKNGDGIISFLWDAFYIDGACGASIISDMSGVAAERLIPKPDYTGKSESEIPVTNPALTRWILLLTQIGQPDTEESEIIYKLYLRFMAQELFKAKLLVPIQTDGPVPTPNKDGVVLFPENVKISFSTMTGKDGNRDAVRMYTDYKKYNAEFTNEWNAMVGPASDMIGTFDVAINMSRAYKTGCLINKDMFNELKELVK